MNLEPLDFVVVSLRTGNPIAAFLLPVDAVKYIAYRRSVEGPNGPLYEVQNADGMPTTGYLDQKVEIANEGVNPYQLIATNQVAADHFGAIQA